MKEFPENKAVLDGELTVVDAYFRESIDLYARSTATADNETSLSQRLNGLKEARRRFEQLTDYSASTPHFLDWVAECELELGKLLLLAGNAREADHRVQLAESMRASPLLRGWTGELPICKTHERGKERNIHAYNMVKGKAALLVYLEGARLFDQLADFSPGTKVYSDWLGGCEAGAAGCLSALRQVTEARRKFESSIRLRQRLSQSGWRRLTTTCKLANTEYDSLRNREKCTTNPRALRADYSKCCSKFYEVLSQGYGLHHVDRYLSAAERLLDLSHTAAELADAEAEIDRAINIANTASVAFATEFSAARLLEKKAARTKRVALRTSQTLQVALCCVVLLLLGMVDLRLYLLLVIPAAICARVVGVVGSSLAHDERRGFVNILPAIAGTFVGEFHNSLLLCSAAGAVAYLSVMWFLNGRGRCTQSDFVFAFAARVSRRTDLIADQWARWIAQNVPTWLSSLLLEPGASRESPRLRRPLYWIAGCYAASLVAGEVVLVLALAISEYIKAPRTLNSRPLQRSRQNPCTSWAVLLRRPLHLARGDDVPLCALCA